MKIKFNTTAFILIILAAVILGYIYNQFSADGIDLIRKPLLAEPVDEIKIGESKGSLRDINLAQAVHLHSNNLAVFIDSRDQWDYSEGHIEGAINIPEFSFEADNKELQSIDKQKLIVIYCDGGECDISKRLAKMIIELGYTNTFVFLGGLKEWKEAELSIKK